MQRVPPLVEKSPVFAPCVAGHLLHPCLIRMSGNPGQADAATLQMNEEQHVVRHQTTPCKHLDREEVNAGQHRHMRLNELLPGCCLAALRRRPNSMAPQNIPHAFIRHPIAEIGQSAHDPVVPPTGILFGHLQRSAPPASVRFAVCRGNDGVSSRRTSGQLVSGTKPKSCPAWPRRPPGPEPCAQFACRFRPRWISPDRISANALAAAHVKSDSADKYSFWASN